MCVGLWISVGVCGGGGGGVGVGEGWGGSLGWDYKTLQVKSERRPELPVVAQLVRAAA